MQAVAFFNLLSGTLTEARELIDLCKVFRCDIYVRCCWAGSYPDEHSGLQSHLLLDGHYALMDPEKIQLPARNASENYPLYTYAGIDLPLYGEGFVKFEFQDGSENRTVADTWLVSLVRNATVLFKPSDIEALAANVTGKPTLEDLHQQLEHERAARRILESRPENFETLPKSSHLLAIAGLLELLMDDSRPRYRQGGIATIIDAKGWSGASSSQLTKLFATANRAAKEADKEARPKREIWDALGCKVSLNQFFN